MLEADPKALKSIAQTIRHVARAIRRSNDLEEEKLKAFSKLTYAYGNLLAIGKPMDKEWDVKEMGDPTYYEALSGKSEE